MRSPSPLKQLAENLWVAERPQAFYGLEVGTRMTVIRLADGSLLPSSIGVNPMMTIIAMASRVARQIADRLS